MWIVILGMGENWDLGVGIRTFLSFDYRASSRRLPPETREPQATVETEVAQRTPTRVRIYNIIGVGLLFCGAKLRIFRKLSAI